MNRIILLSVLYFSTFTWAYGQNWVSSDAVWHYDFGMTGHGFYKIKLGDDTIIQDKSCQKYHIRKYSFFPQPGGIFTQGPITDLPFEYTYSSGDSVFYLRNGRFFLLYDFGAGIGDSWIIDDAAPGGPMQCDSISKVEVTDTARISINGILKRAIYLRTVTGSPYGIDAWVVENLGAINLQFLFPSAQNCDSSIILCFELHTFKCFESSATGSYNPSNSDCEYLLNHVGLGERVEINVNVFPNPTTDVLKVIIDQPNTPRIRLLDLYGRVFHDAMVAGQELNLNMSELPPGVYVLRIESGNQVTTRRIIKE
jgi:hypothetical protein